MGFWNDVFYVVGGIADATETLISGVCEDAKQLGDELLHLHDSSYVSPYEKKAQAVRITEKADDKLYRAQERYRKHYQHTGDMLRRNYERKIKLQKQLKQKLQNTAIYSSVTFREMPDIGFTQKDDFVLGDMLGIFGHSLRDAAASSYLEDAKDYKVSVDREIARIESKDAVLDAIESQMRDEDRLFDMLEHEIARKTETQQYKMAELIRKLLNEAVCNSAGSISQEYLNLYRQLNNLV